MYRFLQDDYPSVPSPEIVLAKDYTYDLVLSFHAYHRETIG